MSNVWLCGRSGRMGEVLVRVLRTQSHWHWCGGTTSAGDGDRQGKPLALKDAAVDVVIDFSTPAGNATLLKTLQRDKLRNKSVLIATTGLGASLLAEWHKATVVLNLRVLLAPNTSVGVALLVASA